MLRSVHPTSMNVNLMQDLSLYKSRVSAAELLRQANASLATTVNTLLAFCCIRMQSISTTLSSQVLQEAINSAAAVLSKLLHEFEDECQFLNFEAINPIDTENPRFYMLEEGISFLQELVKIEMEFLSAEDIQEGKIVELIQSLRWCSSSDELHKLHTQLKDNNMELGEVFDEEVTKHSKWDKLYSAALTVSHCIDNIYAHCDANE